MSVSVLFVCLGNICRSPTGEAIARKLVEQAGLSDQVEIESAGTAAYHSGEPPDERMRVAGEKRGYEFVTTARKVYPEQDFEKFDYILAADQSNIRNLKAMMKTPDELDGKLFLMCEFSPSYQGQEVPDPYYGGPDGFEEVLDLLEDACQGWLDHVKKERLSK